MRSNENEDAASKTFQLNALSIVALKGVNYACINEIISSLFFFLCLSSTNKYLKAIHMKRGFYPTKKLFYAATYASIIYLTNSDDCRCYCIT